MTRSRGGRWWMYFGLGVTAVCATLAVGVSVAVGGGGGAPPPPPAGFTCPDGSRYSPATGKCELPPECPSGMSFDPNTGECRRQSDCPPEGNQGIVSSGGPTFCNGRPICPEGMTYDNRPPGGAGCYESSEDTSPDAYSCSAGYDTTRPTVAACTATPTCAPGEQLTEDQFSCITQPGPCPSGFTSKTNPPPYGCEADLTRISGGGGGGPGPSSSSGSNPSSSSGSNQVDPGLPPPPAVPPPNDPAPDSSGFKIVPNVFGSAPVRLSRTGGDFRFTISEDATARIAIFRRQPGLTINGRCLRATSDRTRRFRGADRCTYLSPRGALTQSTVAGFNQIHYSGHNPLNGRRLPSGPYRALLTLLDSSGQQSDTERANFRVIR